jgi:Spy/CpxP family protein refolding chaperone
MKKLFVGIIALSAFAFSASAQDQRASKGKKDFDHGNHQKGMMKDLNLTDAQKAQMKASREEMKAKMDALKANTALTDDQRKQQREALMMEQRAKMESILTPEQKAKMATSSLGKQGKDKKEWKRGGEGHREGMEKMKTELGLSNDQAAKLKALNEQSHTQMKAIRENTALTEAAKKEQMKAVKENAKTQRQSILTAEQIKKMEEMKKNHKKAERK